MVGEMMGIGLGLASALCDGDKDLASNVECHVTRSRRRILWSQAHCTHTTYAGYRALCGFEDFLTTHANAERE